MEWGEHSLREYLHMKSVWVNTKLRHEQGAEGMRLQGKTAVITGGAGSLGTAQTTLFAEQGANVVFVDVVADVGSALQDRLMAAGHHVQFVHADITTQDGWQAIVERTTAAYGGVDVLVNNAGLSSMMGEDPFDPEVLQLMLDIKLKAPLLGVRACIPSMTERGGGSVVNICSVAALIAVDPGNFGYTAGNAGLAGLTRAIAWRFGRNGIRANSIFPGAMPPMRDPGAQSQTKLAPSREALASLTAAGRTGEPIDIAYAALYLASDESSYVTGAELVVDGGVVAR